MILRCGLLLMVLAFVRTTEYSYDYGLDNMVTEVERRYSYWPSVHNALLKLRKREVKGDAGLSEGGEVAPVASNQPTVAAPAASSPAAGAPIAAAAPAVPAAPAAPTSDGNVAPKPLPAKPELPKLPVTNDTAENHVTTNNESSQTAIPQAKPKQLDLKDSRVVMRGLIVFGGFLLLAVAYYIFYRRKGNKNDAGNTHNSIDANQFRYGVLQSEDRRDNLELSRVPLTMESDDDEDEDLEIFDLEQKKKSLSYVNLQTNDEDIVFHNSTHNGRDNDKDNLLLDIEDASTDTLINWSNNGNKSIL
ncbi:uncharacterized protein LOC126366319 [Pectinophora gossypiella]|nr:uncharacterized protein LOC126366319 [Pectinophora gossypiella]